MLGMLLDQQVTMEWAFGAPLLLKRRLGVDHLDAAAIAAMDPDGARGGVPRQARAAPLPGIDGEAHP